MERRQAEVFIRRRTWLSQTPSAFQDQLLAKCDLLDFRAREPVYEAGDESGGLFGVIEGRIELHLPTHDEAPTLAFIGGPGFWAGDMAAVTGRTRRIAVVSGSDCQLLRLSRAELLRIASNDPTIWRHISMLLARNLAKAIDAVDALKRSNPTARVAATLLNLVDDEISERLAVNASQLDIAALARLSRSAVHAALKALERRGLISRRYNSIELTSVTSLRQFVWRPIEGTA